MRLELPSLALIQPSAAAQCIAAFVEALILSNREYLRTHLTPPLYSCGVTYKESDEWLDIPAILKRRAGDCKSLVAWRVAELRNTRREALLQVSLMCEGGFHVSIRKLVKGAVQDEDPSRFLGMR